jgi:thiol-disulfide isomerase/thioredoxin
MFCLCLTGCNTFGKKSQGKQNLATGASGGPGSSGPAEGAGFAPGSQALPPEVGGILAGRVLDSYDRQPPLTYIRLIPAQDKDAGTAKAAPIEVATDGQGFFTIHNLKPGQHYQLIARTREGEQPKLSGTTWAIPPNPRVLIYINEAFATANTPAAPAAPEIPGQKPKSKTAEGERSNSGEQGGGSSDAGREPAKTNSINGPPGRTVEIGAPIRVNESGVESSGAYNDPAQRVPVMRPEDIAKGSDAYARHNPPLTSIPSQEPARQDEPTPASRAPAYAAGLPTPSVRVPSCVKTGRQLDNYALNDLNGQPWEYRNHRGKVVLLDFWGTWCPPCLAAIPHLKSLQQQYGPYGLEVIGIDYERSGTFIEQIRKVENVRDRLNINYRLLLGTDMRSCPVKTQFGVENFPTLVLLDANNRVIWQKEGLDTYKLQELEVLIRQQLQQ